jgi:hypothetical protein
MDDLHVTTGLRGKRDHEAEDRAINVEPFDSDDNPGHHLPNYAAITAEQTLNLAVIDLKRI